MLINYLFAIASLIICMFLIIYDVRIYKSDYQSNKVLLWPIGIGMLTVITYAGFIVSTSIQMATVLNTLYFVNTIWLAYTMLLYGRRFTGFFRRKEWLKKVVLIMCVADTVYQLLNILTPLTYEITERSANYKYGHFWSVNLFSIHYLHLGVCYLMVGSTLVMLIIKAIKVPKLYKPQYINVFAAYLGVIIVNMICYTTNLEIDLSVPLYAILASFVCYHSRFGAPRKLVMRILREINTDTEDAILYFDAGEDCIYANERAQKMLGNPNEGFTIKAAENFRKQWLDDVNNANRYTKNERTFEVEYQELTEGNKLLGSYMILRDRTDEIKEYDRQRYLSTHDSLTGLYNRDYFFSCVEELLEKEPDKPRIIMASNIKNFKLINELYGRDRGDEVLKTIAKMMETRSWKDNLYGRIGDDKFAMIMREDGFIPSVFEESIQAIQKKLAEKNFNLQVNIGVYKIKPGERNVSLMYDKACLAVKQESVTYQDIFVYYDDSIMRKLQLEKEILIDFRESIESRRFEIKKLPIVDTDVNVIGVEAIPVWNYSSYFTMDPQIYLSILEREGLRYRLDRFVWEEAIMQHAKIEDQDRKFTMVSISAKDIYYMDVFHVIMRLLDRYQVNPKNLVVSISESVIMSEPEKYAELLEKFRNVGIRVVMSGFGSSYSSLNVLKDIHMDMISLETNLMTQIYDFDKSKIILSSMVKMAKNLNMDIIAGDINNEEQAAFMKELGCELLEGSFFSELLGEI